MRPEISGGKDNARDPGLDADPCSTMNPGMQSDRGTTMEDCICQVGHLQLHYGTTTVSIS